MAGVGFVAAQAGSLDFLRVQLEFLKPASADQSGPVRVGSAGQARTQTRSSPDRAPESVGAGRVDGSGFGSGSLTMADLNSDTEDSQANTDADLFQLPSLAIPAGFPGSQTATTFGRRSGAIPAFGGGGGSAERAHGAGSQRRRALTGLADCCGDDTDPQDASQFETPLTAPLLPAVALGPVPESATWAMMILGIGLSGVVMRNRRRLLA